MFTAAEIEELMMVVLHAVHGKPRRPNLPLSSDMRDPLDALYGRLTYKDCDSHTGARLPHKQAKIIPYMIDKAECMLESDCRNYEIAGGLILEVLTAVGHYTTARHMAVQDRIDQARRGQQCP